MATLTRRGPGKASGSDDAPTARSSSGTGDFDRPKAVYGNYLKVVSSSKDTLHLVHTPSTRAWATMCGFVGFGLLLFVLNPTSLFWKVVQLGVCTLLGFLNLEYWEECIIDKKKGSIFLRRYNFIDVSKYRFVVLISDVEEVHLGQHALGYGGMGKVCYRAELILNTGIVVPITDTYSLGQRKSVEKVVNDISNLLGLETSSDLED